MYISNIVDLFATQWRKQSERGKLPDRTFQLSEDCKAFAEFYDDIQQQLQIIGGTDETLSGIK